MIATVTLNPSLDEWVQLPVFRLGALNRASSLGRYPGGKGINVSRVLHELGRPTIALGVAGGDDGHILRKLLRQQGITHDLVDIEGMTRSNYKILTARPRGLTELNTTGPTVQPRHLRTLWRRLAASRRCTGVALCGSLPPGVPHTIYRRWIRALRRRGLRTILDTSGQALREGLSSRPWLIKPNRQEFEGLLNHRLGSQRRLIRALGECRHLGAELIIVSLGQDGALLATASQPQVWWARPPAVRVRSAVGAGDSLVAGFLAGWRPRGLLEAFRLAVACGTAAAMTPGTELCHRRDVRRVLPRIAIRRVSG